MKRKTRPSLATPMAQRRGVSAPPLVVVRPANDDVNWLNVGLMLASCAAAIVAPFHVFLFAYIVLGPLHYLTEISWLHDRNYFTRRSQARRWWLALVAVATLVMSFSYATSHPPHYTVSPQTGITLTYLVFAAAAAAIYIRNWWSGAGLLLVLGLALSLGTGFKAYVWVFLVATLLTSIVHVFVFTGAFILYGALKSRSRIGLLSLAVFVSCAVAALFVAAPFKAPTDQVKQLYLSFEFLNRALLVILFRSRSVYESVGISVMRLIAFAYLYHYLNWFSKTSIIKWHEIPRSRAVSIVGLWLAGGMLYLYDYRAGLGVFYILSMLHVFLEFPLNHQTFVDIGRLLAAGLRGRSIGGEPAQAVRAVHAGSRCP
jgi:hypothetical protein